MKYLFLLGLLVGCGGKKEKIDEPVALPEFVEVELTDITYRDKNFNGDIDHINSNSWAFTSHTNNACINSSYTLKSKCRKVNASIVEGVTVANRVTKIQFELMVADINLNNAPYFDILYQDWVRINPDDANGNHPITTIKLKAFNGKLHLAHYDNSWQWGYDFGDDEFDSLHNHDENTLNGYKEIDIGVDYNIELLTYDSGRFIFKVNDVVISDKYYQVKSPTEEHVLQWGQYWDKGYNTDNDPLKRIVIRIDDFKVLTN